MIETIHLSFGNLIIGALFFIIPLYALYAFKVEIWRRTLKALATMAVALTLGALLTVLAVRAGHIGVTLLCALVLLAATAWYMRIKARIRQANYIVPIMLGLTLTILPLSLIFVYLVLGMNPLAPHLLLPVVAAHGYHGDGHRAGDDVGHDHERHRHHERARDTTAVYGTAHLGSHRPVGAHPRAGAQIRF